MPRQVRREFAGAIYHVMNRGDRREDIFRDEQDLRMFLAALTEACRKTDWQIPRGRKAGGTGGQGPPRAWKRDKPFGVGSKSDAPGQQKRSTESASGGAAEKRDDNEPKRVAEHLQMGSWTHVSNLLGAKRKTEGLKSETLVSALT
jgi:hypothetical protein